MTDQSGFVYSHGRHVRAVQAAARLEGIRGAAFAVLVYLCDSADFRRPEVMRSKQNIIDRTGYARRAVKEALQELREKGFLVALAYAQGGRHRATVYRLEPGRKGGEKGPPLPEKGGPFPTQKGVPFGTERGSLSDPPSVPSSEISSEGRKGGAFRAGRTLGGLDAGAGASPPAPQHDEAEIRRFAAEVRAHGYGEARRRQVVRLAAQAAGPGNCNEGGEG